MEKVFKVKKGVTQMTFEGNLIEGGAEFEIGKFNTKKK